LLKGASLLELKSKALAFFLLALYVRLVYLFLVVPVDWIGDSYHHWQIAWYTLNIGLSHGRMWDLKGCEYYWPPLPALFEAFLMWMFHSPSILFMRVANIVFSSVSVVLCYLICRKYGEGVGISLAASMSFFPFIVNYDVLAIHEPMMIFFALLGIWLYFKGRDFYAGLSIGLSYLCHFATYLLAPLLGLLYVIHHRSTTRLIPFATGFALVYIPYAYMLYLHTGDALYNVHCLLTFTILGSTAAMRSPLSPIVGPALLVTAIVTLLITVRKVSKLIPMAVIFSGYALYWGVLITFIGAPFSPYEMRYFVLPFTLGLFFLSSGLNRVPFFRLSARVKRVKIHVSSIVLALFSISLLITLTPNYAGLQNAVQYSFGVADYIGEYYTGGTIISPLPDVTYRLTTSWHVPPQRILGPIYCPTDHLEKMMWLKKHNVTLLLWVPGYETDRVFPELGNGKDQPPFFLIRSFSHTLLYKVRWGEE